MLTDLFIKLGFGTNEADVYSALLAHTPASAAYLAKKTGLARSSVYTALNILMSKGLVGVSYKNEVKQFVAEDCDLIGEMLEKEKSEIDTRIDLFKKEKSKIDSLKSDWLKIPQIMFFEGQEGLKKTYLSMMREADPGATMYVMRDEFVWHPAWHFIFEEEWHQKVKEIKVSKDIKTKLLVNDSVEEKEHQRLYDSRQGLNTRFLPKGSNLKQFAMYINRDTLAILSFESGNMVGIKITNQNLAKNYIKIFESLWEKAKSL